ncbi:CLUMA_CG002151, isoform A [Clunio marinus]|uniref:Polypeptide N-acetylgalactosaminyltransferase n=1 Tax=Clunio marinus TaxID=568069 RepID=A0A1J1HPH2_9DIPT|nr:CLUMA_CG002151, isoform A [Clunio marinus]
MIWRRKSSLFKVVLAILAVWFTVVFFFSDSRPSDANVLSPQLLQQHESDAKGYERNNKLKKFIIDSYKEGHEGLANVVNKKQIKNPFDKENVEVDENEMINEIAGEREEEMMEEEFEERKPQIRTKTPSKKRFGQRDGEDVGFIPPPNDLGLESPGELGKPVTLPANLTAEVKKMVDDGWLKNAFNQYVSDLISVHRSLPDPRTKFCKDVEKDYSQNLPDTSVIVTFHNEAWSTLLRSVHSILDRSPDHLIREIILVDDFSDMPHVQKQLEDYMKNYPKVKILRAKKREGLIRARLLGAVHAEAPVLTFLDSHIECTTGWLEPLLDRIAKNTTTVVCPVIDVIDDTTLQYHYHDSSGVQVGGFDWNLQFNWHPVPDSERKRHSDQSEPVWSPTMAGGLFSIDKKFFEKLGMYDPDFDIWGGENLELSFKTWMCGGTLEIVPCSHVGHIFRKRSPYKWRTGVNVLRRNSIRLAEVWMDDYAKYYYQRIGSDKGDFGDISARLQLRKDLKCKSFQWYLDNIFPELFIPGDAVAQGEVRNFARGNRTCLDAQGGKKGLRKPVSLYPCHRQGGNQYWMLSKTGEIRRDEACLDYAGADVILYPCHGGKGNQFWTYRLDTKQLHHKSSDRCMAISNDNQKLLMEDCNQHREAQKWLFENYDASKMRK